MSVPLPAIIQQNRRLERDVQDLIEDLRRVPTGQRNDVIEAIKTELDKLKTS